MDGYALMQQIRQLSEQMRAIPAFALTAYAGKVNQQQAIAARFQAYLSKPVEPDVEPDVEQDGIIAVITRLSGRQGEA